MEGMYMLAIRASLVAQLVKNPQIPWRRNRLHPPVFLSFPGGSDGKEFACNERDMGSIPGLGRFP